MLKYNKSTLHKIKVLLKEMGYQTRFGRGAFNTGYCLLEEKKVVVVNRYHGEEAQVVALVELLQHMQDQVEDYMATDNNDLSAGSLKLWELIKKEWLTKAN